MNDNSKVEYLIVDTSAFIKNAALQDIGKNIITEPGVVSEIKNKRQLRRLVVLPYDLEVKEPFPEDIKFVTEFAKKTGDYASLSATDIRVIALTYRYEKERVGTSHLRQEPEKKKEVVDSSIKNPDDKIKPLVGFYMPEGNEGDEENNEEQTSNNGDENVNKNLSTEDNKEENKNEVEANNENEKLNLSNDCSKEIEIQVKKKENSSSPSSSVESEYLKTVSENDESTSESDYDTAESDEEDSEVDVLNKKFEKLNCNPEDLKLDCEDDLTVDDILKPVKNNFNKEDEGVHDSESQDEEDEDEDEDYSDNDDDDDDAGWITPKNITNVRKQIGSGVVKEKPATVACLTMDYAMQNVLMQIGLNVASLEGKVIKEMRTFILRCYACFKTTGVVTKVFCPHCGNKTLKKVAVSLDDEGKQKIHINFKKPLTARGKRFSLPTFQGGKHACNPILFEDQPTPDQRPTKLGRTKNDPLNEDYITGYSPFVMRDVNSRAAMLGIKSGTPIKYWMRRNPNEVRKHKK